MTDQVALALIGAVTTVVTIVGGIATALINKKLNDAAVQRDVADQKLNVIHDLTNGNLTEAVGHIASLQKVIVTKDALANTPRSDKAAVASATADVISAVAEADRPVKPVPPASPLFPAPVVFPPIKD